MADIPLGLLPHRVAVERFGGAGAYDDTYGPKAQVQCLRDGRVEFTADGQLVDPVTVYCRLQYAALFAPQSRVTWTDQSGEMVVAYVQVRQERSDGGLGAWQHLEVVVR